MTGEGSLKKVSLHEAALLQAICNDTYSIYFGDHWEADGLELYLEEQFGTEQLLSDINNKRIDYFFICYQQEPVGFLKINYQAVCEGFDSATSCELEKMYIFPEHRGKGLGKIALKCIVDTVHQKGIRILHLCVLDTNRGAISFYERLGFQFHSKFRLKYYYFKEELKGLHRMYLKLK